MSQSEPATDKSVVTNPAHKSIPKNYGVKSRLGFGLAVIAFLVFGLGGWAMTAELSGAVIAPGSVVVDRNVKKIQHRDGGIVSKIFVRNGDRVSAGDILVTLDKTQLKANLGIISSQLIELTARSARLIAERDDAENVEFPKDLVELGSEAEPVMRGEKRLFRVNREARQGQIEQLELRIKQLMSEIEGLQAQQNAKAGELALINKELVAIRGLKKRNLTTASRVYAMEREATRLEGERGGLMSQIARAEGQISEVRVQILSIQQSARSEAQKQLREIEARMTELKEREIAAKDQLARVDLRAPLAGTVHELAVHTIGGVITPAEPVMLLVPEGDDLSIEARIAPSDIDQVIAGQSARLRFSAFSQQNTPELSARVQKVSADVSQDPETGQRYYVGRLAITDDIAGKLGDQKIIPGMPVEVFITTGERTALSYLTKPFVDQLARTFREN